jgi:prevent-host-death family protein
VTYTVQEARERLSEILQQVQDGERVVISDEGQDVAEILAVKEPVSTEDAFRELVAEGILLPASEPRASLEEVVHELEQAWSIAPPKPGALARFLESRD